MERGYEMNISVMNLVTGEIIPYEQLLPMDSYNKQEYYPWGM